MVQAEAVWNPFNLWDYSKIVQIYSLFNHYYSMKKIYIIVWLWVRHILYMEWQREDSISVNGNGTNTSDQFIRLFQIDDVLQVLDSQFRPDDIVANAQDLCCIQCSCLWIQNGAAAQARRHVQTWPNVDAHIVSDWWTVDDRICCVSWRMQVHKKQVKLNWQLKCRSIREI